MSASVCVAFYGLRYEISRNEIEALETRADPRVLAARKAGLKYYWGNFGGLGDRHILFIGAQLAILGPENDSELTLSTPELQAVMEATNRKLQTAALVGEASFYIQREQDT